MPLGSFGFGAKPFAIIENSRLYMIGLFDFLLGVRRALLSVRLMNSYYNLPDAESGLAIAGMLGVFDRDFFAVSGSLLLFGRLVERLEACDILS